jgi:hypothetical protein
MEQESAMSWPPDMPDLPIKKPKELEMIEQLDNHILAAMDDVEIEERIRDAARAIAKEYHKELGGDYDSCKIIVSSALTETGGSIGGHFGESMISLSASEAENACRIVFAPSSELDL